MKKQYSVIGIAILVLMSGVIIWSQQVQAPAQEQEITERVDSVPSTMVPPPATPSTPPPSKPVGGTPAPKPAPAPATVSLTTKSWVWTKTQYNDGTTVTSKKPNTFVVTFNTDKTFSLRTDCNGVGGTYAVQGNTLTLSNMVSTQMFCEGSQEQAVITMLTNIQSYMLTDNGTLVLLLRYDSGSMIFI